MYPCFDAIENEFDRAFAEELFDNYAVVMYKTAYSILGVQALAEEAVQLSFLRIIDYLHLVKNVQPDKRRAYLAAVSRNAARQIYNKEKRQMELNRMADRKRTPKEPLQILMDRYQTHYVIQLIRSLGETYADALLLKYIYGMEEQAIARRLKISVAALRKRVTRGKKLLKQLLEVDRRG